LTLPTGSNDSPLQIGIEKVAFDYPHWLVSLCAVANIQRPTDALVFVLKSRRRKQFEQCTAAAWPGDDAQPRKGESASI
jgi:hypothetical protein